MTTLDDAQHAQLVSLRDRLVAAAEHNRCQLCMGHLDEPAPGCAGPHVGPARRRRPTQAAGRTR